MVLLVVQVGLLALAAFRIIGWAWPSRPPAVSALLGFTLFAGLILAVSTLLGAVGQLRPLPLVALEAVIAAATALPLFSAREKTLTDRSSPSGGVAEKLVAGYGALVAGLALALSLGSPSGEYDTNNYHAINFGTWLNAGNLWQVPFARPGGFENLYPGGVETVGVWLALTRHDDTLVYVIPVFFGMLAVLACAAAAEELSRPWWLGALLGLAVLTSPASWGGVHSLLSDQMAMAGLSAAVALSLRCRHDPAVRSLAATAGAALGLAVASKYTAVLPALMIGCAMPWLAPAGRRWAACGMEALAMVTLGGFWYLRNLVVAGSPVFPQGFAFGSREVFARGHSVYLSSSFTMLHWIAPPHLGVLKDFAVVSMNLVGPSLAFLLSCLVVVGARQADRTARMLSVLSLGLAFQYLATPFTGGTTDYGTYKQLIAVDLRFLLPAALMGGLALLATIGQTRLLVLLALANVYDAVHIAGVGHLIRADLQPGRPSVVFGLGCAVVAVGALSWGRIPEVPRSAVSRAGIVAMTAGLSMAALSYVAGVASVSNEVPALIGTLDRPRLRIAVIDVDNVRSLMGPRLDTTIVGVGSGPLARQEAIYDPLLFEAALAQLRPDILVTDLHKFNASSSRPKTWQPSAEWMRVGVAGDGDVYVRRTPVPH
jgi:hypothetical protein